MAFALALQTMLKIALQIMLNIVLQTVLQTALVRSPDGAGAYSMRTQLPL